MVTICFALYNATPQTLSQFAVDRTVVVIVCFAWVSLNTSVSSPQTTPRRTPPNYRYLNDVSPKLLGWPCKFGEALIGTIRLYSRLSGRSTLRAIRARDRIAHVPNRQGQGSLPGAVDNLDGFVSRTTRDGFPWARCVSFGRPLLARYELETLL